MASCARAGSTVDCSEHPARRARAQPAPWQYAGIRKRSVRRRDGTRDRSTTEDFDPSFSPVLPYGEQIVGKTYLEVAVGCLGDDTSTLVDGIELRRIRHVELERGWPAAATESTSQSESLDMGLEAFCRSGGQRAFFVEMIIVGRMRIGTGNEPSGVYGIVLDVKMTCRQISWIVVEHPHTTVSAAIAST